MVHDSSHTRLRAAVTALIVLALADAGAPAEGLSNPGFEREGPVVNRCATTHVTNPDALPGSEDPSALMRTLRQRGLADADPSLRARSATGGTLARGPGSLRCDTLGPGVAFRGAPLNRSSNRN